VKGNFLTNAAVLQPALRLADSCLSLLYKTRGKQSFLLLLYIRGRKKGLEEGEGQRIVDGQQVDANSECMTKFELKHYCIPILRFHRQNLMILQERIRWSANIILTNYLSISKLASNRGHSGAAGYNVARSSAGYFHI
jgi:hypothetical protein